MAVTAVALGGFLAVLALLATQLRNNPSSVGLVTARPRVIVVRRIYETTVHERIIGPRGPGRSASTTTIARSSASVTAHSTAPPVTTRAS